MVVREYQEKKEVAGKKGWKSEGGEGKDRASAEVACGRGSSTDSGLRRKRVERKKRFKLLIIGEIGEAKDGQNIHREALELQWVNRRSKLAESARVAVALG
jgi:hypothetical protein